MKTWVAAVLGLVLSLPLAHAEHTRVTNPNAFSVEAFGRGIIWNAQYDRVISDDVSGGIGFGTVGASNGAIATLIPVFVNVYFARAQGSLYATAGATIVPNAASVSGATTATGNLQIATFPLIANAGLGYENRSDAGFLIRITAYGMYALNFIPWFGVTLGYSF